MKRISISHHPLLRTLLGLWLLLASGFGTGGLLVCQGDDGHLDIGDHGCCPQSAESGPIWHEADCGDCSDTLLRGALPAVAPARTLSLPIPVPHAGPPIALPSGARAVSGRLDYATREAPPHDPTLRRRVVLQI